MPDGGFSLQPERFNPALANPPRSTSQPAYQLVEFQHHEVKQHHGPLPQSSEITAYDKTFPGAAKILFDNFDQQSKHRREMERFTLQAEANERMLAMQLESKEIRLGQILGFAAFTLFISLAFYAFYTNHPWTATLLGTIGIGSVVTAFVTGRQKKPNMPPPASSDAQDGN